MLNIINRYSNVTADILLLRNTDLPVRVNEESRTCIYSQNEKVYVIDPIIVMFVALQSLSLSLSVYLSLSLCLSLSLSVCLPVYRSVCVCVSLSLQYLSCMFLSHYFMKGRLLEVKILTFLLQEMFSRRRKAPFQILLIFSLYTMLLYTCNWIGFN